MTRIELATKLKVSMETVWRWEAGKMKPSFEHLRALETLFGIPIEAVVRHHSTRPKADPKAAAE
jgi:transcriptional regulator with XRE-family HTH domain